MAPNAWQWHGEQRRLSHDSCPRIPGTANRRDTSRASVRVPVVDIRKVRVRVAQRRVHMRMLVRLAAVPHEGMRVRMVFVMHMAVRVCQWFVQMLMRMPLHQVQRHTGRHQQQRRPKRDAWHLRPEHQRQCHTEQRRHGEVGAGARGAAERARSTW